MKYVRDKTLEVFPTFWELIRSILKNEIKCIDNIIFSGIMNELNCERKKFHQELHAVEIHSGKVSKIIREIINNHFS